MHDDPLRRAPVRVRCLRNLVKVVPVDCVGARADASLANLIQVAPVVGVLSSGVVRDFHDACVDGASNGASRSTGGTGAFC